MKRVRSVMIGSDCEFFLMNRDTKEIVSGEGYIKGTKWEPFQFDPANKFFATSLDNVLAEICVPPVTPEQKEQWIQNFLKSINYINATIPGHLCTVALPSAVLDEKYLQSEQARIFGCESDYNVWIRKANPKPKPDNPGLRSAGLHVHFGHEDRDNQETNEMLVKACDLVLGVPSILMEPPNERRKLYGKAGTFRFKEYGIEYRTLSGYFASEEHLLDWVFRSANKAVDMVNSEFPFDDYAELIQDSINNANIVTAQRLVNEFDLETA